MPGKLIQLLEPVPSNEQNEEEGFQLNKGFAEKFESQEKLNESKVAIISVAGAFRKGKSFLLNFFLRYLRAITQDETQDWIRSRGQLDDGFHWRSGIERDTAGILIWSEPFFIRKPDGEEVAVLLMDTQGTFDHQSTQQDCTTIFAFSTLLSSLQIFNISQNIQETDLQHLRLFVEFASMAKKEKEKVLQHLWFLIRDWQNPSQYEYGVVGGENYLRKVLASDDKKPRENQELRQGIKQHFEQASCCLLPYPGKVVTDKEFEGKSDDLDADFVKHLEQFVFHILSPKKLVVKKVNGKELTGQELFSLVKVYFEEFRPGKLPTPQSIFTANVNIAKMANGKASDDALSFFKKSISPQKFNDEKLLLQNNLDRALKQFDENCMGKGSEDTKETREKLEKDLRNYLQLWLEFKQTYDEKKEKKRKEGNGSHRDTEIQQNERDSNTVTAILADVASKSLNKMEDMKREQEKEKENYDTLEQRHTIEKDALEKQMMEKDEKIAKLSRAMEHLQQQIDEGNRRKKNLCSIS